MRRVPPGQVQLPPGSTGNSRSTPFSLSKARQSPGGGSSPLARTSTTAAEAEASYFHASTSDRYHNQHHQHQKSVSGPSAVPYGAMAGAAGTAPDFAATAAAPHAQPQQYHARPASSRTKSSSSIQSYRSGTSGTGSGASYSTAPGLGSAAAMHYGGGSGSGSSGGAGIGYGGSGSGSGTAAGGPSLSARHGGIVQPLQPGCSPGASSISSGSKTSHAEEIEASLRQWRNHVFPSLKAGNYISPGQETPDRDPIHPIVEPMLPSIFAAGATNDRPTAITYSSAREFLEGVTRDPEHPEYERSWRMEMVLGQTEDIQHAPNSEGIWLAVWSGKREEGTRLLEYCLMKPPLRPLVLISAMPISVLPTALLQDRMQHLLSAYLAHPAVRGIANPFSLVMGPARVVEAFLLHFDGDVERSNMGLERYHAQFSHFQQQQMMQHSPYHAYPYTSHESSSGSSVQQYQQRDRERSSSIESSTYSPVPTTPGGGHGHRYGSSRDYGGSVHIHHASSAAGRTVKPLLHTRIISVPPAISLSDGFVVRLANEEDDLQCLTSLFQAYSSTLDHHLDAYTARRALSKAMSSSSVWIYHIASQSFPGLSLIAGFLTTERRRRFRPLVRQSRGGDGSSESEDAPIQGGSISITAVFVDEAYRGRGVAESLVRTATRYYLTGEEIVVPVPAAPKLKTKAKKAAPTAAAAASDPTPLRGITELPPTPPTDDDQSPGAPAAAATQAPQPPREIYGFVSVYVDPRNESTCRVFSRVGYGIMEKEQREEIPVPMLRNALGEQYRREYEGMLSRRSSLGRELLPALTTTAGTPDQDDSQKRLPAGAPNAETDAAAAAAAEQAEGASNASPEVSTPTGLSAAPADKTPQPTSSLEAVGDPLAELAGPALAKAAAQVSFAEGTEEAGPAAREEQADGPGQAPAEGYTFPGQEAEQEQEESEDDGPPLPLCRSVEEWQVVSLQRPEERRVKGVKRDDVKRLSIDGPWQ